MEYKNLICPEFRVTVGGYELNEGISVECFSSRESHADWAKVKLSPELQEYIQFTDLDESVIELGYEDDFEVLLVGSARTPLQNSSLELMIQDDMIKLQRLQIKASFLECRPQDIIRYILISAGIEDYVIDDTVYDLKKVFSIDQQNGLDAMQTINNFWGIKKDFFFRDQVFYWGTKPIQDDIYVLEENNSIIDLDKNLGVWKAETIGIPWIHHSQEIEVQHSKYSGYGIVEKVIIRSDDKGFVRQSIYFVEEEECQTE